MPVTLLTETQWHGNPRGTPSYAWTVHTEDVPSPYYADGRDVPVIKAAVTDVAFAGYPTVAFTDTTVTLGGTWYSGCILDVRGLLSDSGLVEPEKPFNDFAAIYQPGIVLTATQAAAQAAIYFNGFQDITCVAAGVVLTFGAEAPYDTIVIEDAYEILP